MSKQGREDKIMVKTITKIKTTENSADSIELDKWTLLIQYRRTANVKVWQIVLIVISPQNASKTTTVQRNYAANQDLYRSFHLFDLN